MKFKLNENQQMIQDYAKDFSLNVLSKYMDKAHEDGCISDEVFKQMCDAGFMGLIFEEKYGGSNLGYDAYALMTEQLSRYAPGMNAPISVSTMFLIAVLMYGSQEMIDLYAPPLIAGDMRGSFAFTEASTGSDPKQLTSTYELNGEEYVINGVKRFITNAGYKGPILVFAKDAQTGDISGFVFEKFCPGYSLSSAWELVCNETSPIYDVFMDNIRVPKNQVLGKIGQGFDILKEVVSISKLSVAASCVGTMGRAYDISLKYVKEKMHRDKPITKFPTIRTKVAKVAAMHQSAQLLVYRLAEYANDPNITKEELIAESAMVKGYVSDLCVECCQMAMTLLGAYGVCKEYHIEQVMRDALRYPIVEGVSDLQYILSGSYLSRPDR